MTTGAKIGIGAGIAGVLGTFIYFALRPSAADIAAKALADKAAADKAAADKAAADKAAADKAAADKAAAAAAAAKALFDKSAAASAAATKNLGAVKAPASVGTGGGSGFDGLTFGSQNFTGDSDKVNYLNASGEGSGGKLLYGRASRQKTVAEIMKEKGIKKGEACPPPYRGTFNGMGCTVQKGA